MYPTQNPKTGLYGYWGNNQWLIEPKYAYAHNFEYGYAAVELNSETYQLVNPEGVSHSVTSICGGRSLTKDFTFTGFTRINDSPAEYAVVCIDDDGRHEWGLIDIHLAYAPLPDSIFSVASHAACYGDFIMFWIMESVTKARYGLYNIPNRKLLISCDQKYNCIYSSNETIWVVSRRGASHLGERTFAFYDVRSNEIISDWYWEAKPFACGFGAFKKEERSPWYFVDETLEPVFDRGFEDVGRFSEGLADVLDGEDGGYIDTTGRLRLLLPYEELNPFNRFGWAIANRNINDWDLDVIDRTGKARLTGFETAVYWEGDFPYFELTKGKERFLVDMDLQIVYQGPA